MTDDIRCPICCRRDPAEGRTVCDPCLGRLDDDLARIVELTKLADRWLHHPRTNASPGARAVPSSRPPLDLSTLDAVLGNDVLPVVESWERMAREFYGLSPYGPASEARNRALAAEQVRAGVIGPPPTVKGCIGFLRANLLRMAESADWPIDDYAREIRDLRLDLERLDPDHERPDGMRVPCPAPHRDHDGRACGYRLVVVMDRAADDLPCPRCGETWSGNRLILVALNDPAVTVWAYPDVIVETLGIRSSTLRQWVKRGHVAKNGNRYDAGAAYRKRHRDGTGVA